MSDIETQLKEAVILVLKLATIDEDDYLPPLAKEAREYLARHEFDQLSEVATVLRKCGV